MMPFLAECLPHPSTYTAPDFTMPDLACDSHSHVTPTTPWALAPDASYRPSPSPPSDAVNMRDALGFKRGIAIQASAFGVDNAGVFEALKCDPDAVRGIIVAKETITDRELRKYHSQGVRGMRFITNGLGGSMGIEVLLKLAPRMAEMGWQVELLPSGSDWEALLPILLKLPCTVVIDHMGRVPPEADLTDPAVKAMRRLVSEGGAYVKLVSYRLSPDLMNPNLVERAKALYEDAPDRMLWGTDWPHVGLAPMADAGVLLNSFAMWFERDEIALKRILADNPQRLFAF